MASNKKISNVASAKKESRLPTDVGQKTPGRIQLILTLCFSAFLAASIFCAPEGAIREGDYLPLALLFLLIVVGTSLGTLRIISRVSLQAKDTGSSDVENVGGTPRSARNLTVLAADGALFVYLLLCTVSCLRVVFLHSGNVRFSLNGYWTFITPVFIYFFLRFFRTLFSERLVLEICFVLGACMLAECGFSAYSYAVINPRIREAYRENPDKMLAENGMNFEKDSRERMLFEKRLLESVEPTGTYGLTNTLAGALAPILILALVGIPWLRMFSQSRRFGGGKKIFCWTLIVLILLGFLLAFFVLLATKSRSACLALACGFGIWFILWLFSLLRNGGRNARTGARFALGAIVLLAVVVVVAFFTGAIDREIVTEAGKSLSYRLDYWNATSRMIADNPFFGIGPGEFQNLYARFILPTASEFIADPHNFAFELGALFGIPALTAFGVFLLATLISAVFVSFESASVQTAVDSETSSSVKMRNAVEIDPRTFHVAAFSGLTLGLGTTFFCSFFQSTPVDLNFYGIAFLSFCFFALIVVGLDLIIETSQNRQTPTPALVAAGVALLVNLCAAGGIGYAPISTTLFILAAIVVNRASCNSNISIAEPNKKAVVAVLLISIAITVVFYITSYKPRMNAFLFELRYEANPSAGVKELMSDGTLEKTDPESVVVVSQYYYAVGLAYAQNASQDNLRRWRSAHDMIEQTSPNSSSIRERCGEFDQLQFERNGNRTEFLESAIRFYQEAVELSPTDVGKKEKLFAALKTAGRNDEAKEIARQALIFDKTTPHEDRKLTDNARREMQAFVGDLQ